MPAREWIEVNIHFRGNMAEARRVIVEFIKPFVDSHRRQKQSWHFFQEMCPPNGERPGEREIRLRFFGSSNNIAVIRADLVRDLGQLVTSGRTPVVFYHFGNHGGPGQYQGEAGDWGRDWPFAMKQYQNGANFALKFLSKCPMQNSFGRHGHRYAHLLLNQLTVPHQYTHDNSQPPILTLRMQE